MSKVIVLKLSNWNLTKLIRYRHDLLINGQFYKVGDQTFKISQKGNALL